MPKPDEPVGPPKIVTLDGLRDSIVIAFADGRQCAYSAETLYALIPMEFELARKIKTLLE